jgi:hypothetical protein
MVNAFERTASSPVATRATEARGGIAIGVQIRDNDPRVSFVRVLTVVRIEGDHAVAESAGGREQRIALQRIYTDGKARKSGFDVLPTVV